MTKELRDKYQVLIKQLDGTKYQARMQAFLASPDFNEENLQIRMADFEARIENNYVSKPGDDLLHLIEGFQRKGTIYSPIPEEEILKMARESKRETYL